MIIIENGYIMKNESIKGAEDGNFTIFLIGNDNEYTPFLISNELTNSMFTRLYLMGGAGQNQFSLVHSEPGVMLFKVNFDGSSNSTASRNTTSTAQITIFLIFSFFYFDIEEEIQKTPYNKATSHHIGKLKAKLSKLKEETLQRSSGGSKGQGFHVKKSGDATVVLVGFPSVGKSTLLNNITNAESKVGAYQFTTLDIVPGVMEHKNAKIQVFDIPGIITGASSGKGRGKEILSVARTADLILVVLDTLNPQHIDVIVKELRAIGIRPNEQPPDVTVKRKKLGGVKVSSTCPLSHLDEKTIRSILNEYGYINADVLFRDDVTMDQFIDVLDRNKSYVPMLVLLNKVDLVDEAYIEEMKKYIPEFIPISADKNTNIDELKDIIFDNLDLVRVYLKPQGRKADMEDPLVIKKGSTVIDACRKLHREFVKNFRHAKVWGTSVKFPGQKVGPDHVLDDEDVLRIILKK